MHFCQYCGTPHEPGAKFCAGCGRDLTAPVFPNAAPAAPQYQQPQYQAPMYQPTQYQVPPYQPTPYMGYNPQVNRESAKKKATAAVVICFVALLLQIAALITTSLSYKNMGYTGVIPVSTYVTAVIRFGLCAIFPFLAMRSASTGNIQSAKGIHTGAVCFLCAQAIGVVACFIAWLLIRYTAVGALYNTINTIFSYVAGSNLLSSLPGIFLAKSVYAVSNLMHFVSALCYWISSILCLTATSKLKKF